MDKATEVQATMEKLKERIKDKKYKLTTQRQIILQTFIEPPSIRLSSDNTSRPITFRPSTLSSPEKEQICI